MRERLSRKELDDLGEQIAEQAVHLDAAMHRLLADLRRFDEDGGWHLQGFSSCAHWLSHRVGWDLATARERVRVARALVELPAVDAALAGGALSYSKARAITRVATPATEPTLLQYAEMCTASQLETICRKFHAAKRSEADPKKSASPREDERYVVASSTALGLVCVKAMLLPDEAALLMQVIQLAAAQRGREDDGGGETSEEAAASAEDGAEGYYVDRSQKVAASAKAASRLCNRADGLMAVLQAYARGSSPQRSPIEMIVTTPAEARAAFARSHMPVSRLRSPALSRRSPPATLGRWRRDQPD